MKVNLGCGDNYKEGWWNIDIDSPLADVKWDLNNGLPPGCVDMSSVFSSHCLEHMADDRVLELLKDCRSKMFPGAMIHLCLPDFKKQVVNYLEGNTEFFAPLSDIYNQGISNPQTATLIDYVSYCTYQYQNGAAEHRGIWDADKLVKYLQVAEFTRVTPSDFLPGIDLDNHLRRKYSFYVTAWV